MSRPTAPSSPARVFPESLVSAVLILALLIFMLSLRQDGWTHHDLTLKSQLCLLPFSLIFFILIARACGFLHRSLPLRMQLDGVRLALWVVPLEQLFILLLLAFEGSYFRKVGYRTSPVLLAMLTAVSVAAFVWINRRPAIDRTRLLLLFSSVLYVADSAYCIHCFPLNPLRSDNLPLIIAAGQQFLHGHYPYFTYPLVSGAVVLTYLPATWMAYLPAAILHVDVRWTNTVLALLAVFLVRKAAPPGHRPAANTLLSLFLLLPYMQYHHDIYLGPQWFLLALIYFALSRRNWVLAAAAAGCGCAASQLFWVIIPFFALYLWKAYGLRKSLAGIAVVIMSALAWVLPFYLHAPHDFAYCTFSHWGFQDQVVGRIYNISYWLMAGLRALGLASTQHLQMCQAALLMIVFFAALRRGVRSIAEFFAWAAAALATFASSNFLVWTYFYVTAFFCLTISLAERVQPSPSQKP